jgi:hypothetical protein
MATMLEMYDKIMFAKIKWAQYPAEEKAERSKVLYASQVEALEQLIGRYTRQEPMTEKQIKYLCDLLEKVTVGKAENMTTASASASAKLKLTTLREFLDRSPGKVIFAAEGKYIQCKYTGTEYTKYPQCYHISEVGKEKDYYIGRLTLDAAFLGSQREVYLSALRAIDTDPLAAAVAYGKAVGSCAFCARELSNPTSVHMGYGPICAEKYNLPWEGDDDITSRISFTLD